MKSEPLATAPAVTRIRLNVARWKNLSSTTGKPFIPAAQLAEVNDAFDRYLEFVNSHTIPTATSRERFVQCGPSKVPSWLMLESEVTQECDVKRLYLRNASSLTLTGMGDHPLVQLRIEIQELEERWPDILSEVKKVSRQKLDDLPDGADLWKSFVVLCHIIEPDRSDTLKILSAFSVYHPHDSDPARPSKPEPVDWDQRLADLTHEFNEGRITAEEYQKQQQILDTRRKVWEIEDKMWPFM